MVVVGGGAGVVQVTVDEVNLGVLIPAPEVQLLIAVDAGLLQGRILHRVESNGDADLGEVVLDDGGNVGIGTAGGVGQGGADAAVGIAGLSHERLGAVKVVVEAFHIIIEAPQAAVEDGLLEGALAVDGDGQHVVTVDGAGDSLAQLLVVPGGLLGIEGKVEQAGAGLLVDGDVLVLFEVLQLVHRGIDADVDLTVLQGDDAGGSLQIGAELDGIGDAGSEDVAGGQVIAPVIRDLLQTADNAFFPLDELIGTGADEPGLIHAALPGLLGLDGEGNGSQGVNELVVVGLDLDLNGVLVHDGAGDKARQVAGNLGALAHGHIQSELHVVRGHRGLLTVVEVDIVAQMHDDVGIVGELPVGGQARIKAGGGIGIVVEEEKGLVGVLQDDVVGGILLLLQVQIVDVSGGADDEGILMGGDGILCIGRGADGHDAQYHDEAQEHGEYAFVHSILLVCSVFSRNRSCLLVYHFFRFLSTFCTKLPPENRQFLRSF